jgi:hypothetical protein
MATEKQIEANRLNAQLSTGPRTPEGKKTASLNGTRHGLTGQAIIMTPEDRVAYNAFTKPYIACLNPANPVEAQLAQLLADDNYRLNRIHAIEENTFALGHSGPAANIEADHHEVEHAMIMANVFRLEGKLFQNLSLYEQRLTRNIHKNMKLLTEMQDKRKAEEKQAARDRESRERLAKIEAAIAAEEADETAKPRTRTAAGQSRYTYHPTNGFGFSSDPAHISLETDTAPGAPETPPLAPKIAA